MARKNDKAEQAIGMLREKATRSPTLGHICLTTRSNISLSRFGAISQAIGRPEAHVRGAKR